MSNVPYFKAKEIAKDSYQIEYAFTDREHVYCYLLIGEERALVIDTMYGYGSLKTFLKTLTDKPLCLVNTHFHFDHCAGNFEFDACYLHHADIQNYYDADVRSAEEMLERAREEAFPEYKEQMELQDMVAFRHHIPVCPLYDGDILDLGGRKIRVIRVAGHSAGSVVFLDEAQRIAYTGDCCNSNTLLGFRNSLPVETYLKELLRFRREMPRFDVMYGGHQVLPPSVIEEGILLCSRILTGTDDKEEVMSRFGVMATYGARHSGNGGIERADGGLFNISYAPDRVFTPAPGPRTIDFQKKPMF